MVLLPQKIAICCEFF